jgi:hypothetical protein
MTLLKVCRKHFLCFLVEAEVGQRAVHARCLGWSLERPYSDVIPLLCGEMKCSAEHSHTKPLMDCKQLLMKVMPSDAAGVIAKVSPAKALHDGTWIM